MGVAADRGIIVVDDDPGMSRAITRMLMLGGWSARAFESAEDLMASAELERAALLILDIQLPGLSGLDLHQQLQSSHGSLPVIFITGEDRPVFRERALRAGATAYLTKPFPGQELMDAVRRHFEPAGNPPKAIP
ncbi:response regulator transcription factor [Luteolibacter luteus]|uniref:Response regulator n=1 Tax=Luteolibacter luteus TaxID=2728835 RepID=A0A858RRQ0_9BACT|nr:response regulator [Luteolibacter luteus]QJE98810.1 response regulator [Luteolibacter luteus]